MANSCKGLVFLYHHHSFIIIYYYFFYYYFSLPVADGMLLYYIFCLVQGHIKEAYENESGKQKEISFLFFLFLTSEYHWRGRQKQKEFSFLSKFSPEQCTNRYTASDEGRKSQSLDLIHLFY